MRTIQTLLVAVLSCAVGVAACGEEAEDSPMSMSSATSSATGSAPSNNAGAVVFEDIHPAFVRTCGQSSCHGTGSSMGPGAIGAADLDTAEAATVGKELQIAASIMAGSMPKSLGCKQADGTFKTDSFCLSEQEREDVSAWATGM